MYGFNNVQWNIYGEVFEGFKQQAMCLRWFHARCFDPTRDGVCCRSEFVHANVLNGLQDVQSYRLQL